MISTLSRTFGSQNSSRTDTDRPFSKQRFIEFELERSRDSRRRLRVLSSARRLTALFHHDMKDRHGLR